jgi:hypothetical protein
MISACFIQHKTGGPEDIWQPSAAKAAMNCLYLSAKAFQLSNFYEYHKRAGKKQAQSLYLK